MEIDGLVRPWKAEIFWVWWRFGVRSLAAATFWRREERKEMMSRRGATASSSAMELQVEKLCGCWFGDDGILFGRNSLEF